MHEHELLSNGRMVHGLSNGRMVHAWSDIDFFPQPLKPHISVYLKARVGCPFRQSQNSKGFFLMEDGRLL